MNYANYNTGRYNGPPWQCSADSREEGGTRGSTGAMESRDNKKLMETIWMSTREPRVVNGGFLGEGEEGNGDENQEIRMVNTERNTA